MAQIKFIEFNVAVFNFDNVMETYIYADFRCFG